ncbi:MAG: hypothetical protein NXY57DRAFT_237507 [Lentinula lateritia]|nr:MAG: hypothetical protein NXY57DRAFT_237507 [Lentinula lateritia]
MQDQFALVQVASKRELKEELPEADLQIADQYFDALSTLTQMVYRLQRSADLFQSTSTRWAQSTPPGSPGSSIAAAVGTDSTRMSKRSINSPDESPSARFTSSAEQLDPLLDITLSRQTGQGLLPVLRHFYRIFTINVWDGQTPLKVRELLTRTPSIFPALISGYKGASTRPVRKAEYTVPQGKQINTVKFAPSLPKLIVEILKQHHNDFLERYLDVKTLQKMLAPSYMFYIMHELGREADVEFGVRIIITAVISHLLVLMTNGEQHYFRAGTIHVEDGFEDDGVKRTIPDIEMPPDLVVEVKTWLSFERRTLPLFLGLSFEQHTVINRSESVYALPVFWPTSSTERIEVPDQPFLQMAAQIANRNLIELGMVTSLQYTSYCAIFDNEPGTMYVSRVCNIHAEEAGSLLQHFAFAAIARVRELKLDLYQRLKGINLRVPQRGMKVVKEPGHIVGRSQAAWESWVKAEKKAQGAQRIQYHDVAHEHMSLINSQSRNVHNPALHSDQPLSGVLLPSNSEQRGPQLRLAASRTTQVSGPSKEKPKTNRKP